MSNLQTKNSQKNRLGSLVKVGLLRELYRQHNITQIQLEQLMKLQRT